MARGSERETPAQQTRDHAARDGKRNCEGALRAGRRIARRHQAIQSERANGEITGPPDNRTTDHKSPVCYLVVLLSCSLLPWRRLTQAWSSARNVGRAKWRPKKNRQSGPEIRHSGADLLNAFRQASISPKGSRFSISASNRKLR